MEELRRYLEREFGRMNRRFNRRFNALEVSMDGRFRRMNRRFNRRFDAINERFDEVNERFAEVNERFDDVDDHLNLFDQRRVLVTERFELVEERVRILDDRCPCNRPPIVVNEVARRDAHSNDLSNTSSSSSAPHPNQGAADFPLARRIDDGGGALCVPVRGCCASGIKSLLDFGVFAHTPNKMKVLLVSMPGNVLVLKNVKTEHFERPWEAKQQLLSDDGGFIKLSFDNVLRSSGQEIFHFPIRDSAALIERNLSSGGSSLNKISIDKFLDRFSLVLKGPLFIRGPFDINDSNNIQLAFGLVSPDGAPMSREQHECVQKFIKQWMDVNMDLLVCAFSDLNIEADLYKMLCCLFASLTVGETTPADDNKQCLEM
ncbi:hypothetical protein ACQ4LE_000155 [Meloidogyne hapla]